ncbi:MAG: polysaccharide pyruvyl transferase family protein [Rubritalea sp.]|uniref:polysaccharide pyruvyl transferase family protein n=1 Tax=Rubritalea sp. TaxID=2109375 RepID=UPI00324267D1
MKVGILTFHLGPNHGGYLQAYCLSQFISSLGHEVEIINYKNAGHHQSEIFKPWVYRRPAKLLSAWVKERMFQKAFKNMPLSKFTTDRDAVDWNRYDAVVVGSDVVWDFEQARLGRDPVYFGDFGCDYRGKLISYAPSTGKVDPDATVPEYAQRGLASFDTVSVRDDTTKKVVQSYVLGEVTNVVDPTWLNIDYRERLPQRASIMAVYAFNITPTYRTEIVKYARRKGLKIVALGYPHKWADQNRMDLGPLDWPDFMDQAQCVVAGTFHGTLYAIKLQCQFVTILNDHIKYKVQKPLEITDLEGRILHDPENIKNLMEQPIDYHSTFEKVATWVLQSRKFLQNNL